MNQKLYVFTKPDVNLTQAQVMCFAHQLEKDVLSDVPKLNWEHDRTTSKIGVYVSNGLKQDSKIVIETLSTPKDPAILMSYSQRGRLVYTAYEFCGAPTEPHVLLPLYKKVASVVHKNAHRNPTCVQRHIKIE